MRRGIPKDGLAQGLFNDRLPEYVDFLVPEEPRSQQEAEIIGAWRHGLNDALEPYGCKLAEVTSNWGNQGYRFLLVDRERRPLYVGVTYDEMIAAGEAEGTKAMFDRTLELITSRCIAEIGKRHGQENH